jgi:hypothetical protein
MDIGETVVNYSENQAITRIYRNIHNRTDIGRAIEEMQPV